MKKALIAFVSLAPLFGCGNVAPPWVNIEEFTYEPTADEIAAGKAYIESEDDFFEAEKLIEAWIVYSADESFHQPTAAYELSATDWFYGDGYADVQLNPNTALGAVLHFLKFEKRRVYE